MFVAMDALTTYLDETGEKLSSFACRIGRSPSTLSRTLAGQRNPSVDLALDVEAGTGGKVSAGIFIDICIRSRKAAERSMMPEAAE